MIENTQILIIHLYILSFAFALFFMARFWSSYGVLLYFSILPIVSVLTVIFSSILSKVLGSYYIGSEIDAVLIGPFAEESMRLLGLFSILHWRKVRHPILWGVGYGVSEFFYKTISSGASQDSTFSIIKSTIVERISDVQIFDALSLASTTTLHLACTLLSMLALLRHRWGYFSLAVLVHIVNNGSALLLMNYVMTNIQQSSIVEMTIVASVLVLAWLSVCGLALHLLRSKPGRTETEVIP